ncbi:MAG: LysR family transcriptional regulator [Myxococcota bacterium]
MTQLDDMRVFAEISQSGGVSAAAAVLGMPKQTVSRRLAALEEGLGVELARRTTRSLSLTDVGRAYAARCVEITRLADEANRAAASQLDIVAGTLKITADSSFGETFLPRVVTEFVQRFADVEIDVLLTSRKVDIMEEGFDVAFRVGAPPDVTHLAATALGPARLWTVASPDYIARRGRPKTPDDLRDHACVSLVPNLRHHAWPFAIRGAIAMVPIQARVRVNGLAMARHASLAGAGIAHLPRFAAVNDVEQGRLIRVLDRFSPEVGGLHVVYPHSHLLAPKVTEFIALAREVFAGLGTA